MSDTELTNWKQLYEQYCGAESRRVEQARREAEERAALEDFEAWSRKSTTKLMEDLCRVAAARSRDFLQHTGQSLDVEFPSGPPITVPEGGPEIRFLCLKLNHARVHVYSSHTRGGLIHVHLLPSRQDSLTHNQRLLSEPGAFLVRRPDDAYELRHLTGDLEGAAGTPMSIDALIFKAFRLLVQWAEVGPPPSSIA